MKADRSGRRGNSKTVRSSRSASSRNSTTGGKRHGTERAQRVAGSYSQKTAARKAYRDSVPCQAPRERTICQRPPRVLPGDQARQHLGRSR